MTYRWEQLTKRQQDYARSIARGKLADLPAASVSQVAKHLDACALYDRGEITLDELLIETGWTA